MQPTHLPWTGTISLIDQADMYVLYDTVQFSRQTWQQRNQIRGQDGTLIWLTVPTQKPSFLPIHQTQIAGDGWRYKQWRQIRNAYKHTPHWTHLEQLLEPIYSQPWQQLADLTTTTTRLIAHHLGITTEIVRATTLPPTRPGRIEQLEDIIRHTGATTFLEPQGGSYLLPRTHLAGAQIEWHTYSPAPYTQGTLPWQSHLSVIDVIAWHGSDALSIIRRGYRSRQWAHAQSAANAAAHATATSNADAAIHHADR